MADRTQIIDSQDRNSELESQQANRSVEAWKEMDSLNNNRNTTIPEAFGNFMLTDGKPAVAQENQNSPADSGKNQTPQEDPDRGVNPSKDPSRVATGSRYYVCPDGTVTFKPDCPKERN